MAHDPTTPYGDERHRLGVIIADARTALAGGCTYDRASLAAYAGKLEALLMMLADSAEAELGARRAGSQVRLMTGGEPTLDDLRREFPAWTFFTGVNHLPYGRLPGTSPPIVLMGEDPLDLRDKINGYLGRLPRP